jgi:ABC-2 type transport system permease protein
VVKRYVQLQWIYAKMDFAALLRDTKFMIICVIADLFSSASAMFGIFLLAWRFDGIGGLDRYEVLFMLAFGGIVYGTIGMFDHGNAAFPSRIIGRGQWEHMFIMPLSFPCQMLVGFSPFTCSGAFITGVAMMVIAVINLPALPFWWIFLLLGHVLVSMTVVLGMSYLVSSLTFYAPVQCEEISSTLLYSMEYTATFPLSGMPVTIRASLLTIFPAGLVAWLPTLLILNKLPALANLYPIILAALISLAATLAFKKGFKYYVKKGINRYHAGGHRC